MLVLNLNEFTLPFFILRCWMHRPVYVLMVQPLMPPLQGYLDKLAARMIERGRAKWSVDLVPELRPAWDYDRRLHFKETFKKYEPWQNAYFDFEWADRAREPYGYGYKLVTTNHVFRQAIEIYLIEALVRQRRDDDLRFKGISRDSFEMCRAYFGDHAVSGVHPMRGPNRTLNFISVIIMLTAGSAWIARRIRLSCPSREVFFAFDWYNDKRDLLMCETVADGGDVLLIYRSKAQSNAPLPGTERYINCRWDDGAFPTTDGLKTLIMFFRDTFYLWRQRPSLSPGLFFKTIAMPYRRVKIRGLFNRYRPRHMLGRDDYNVEHILRRFELHRVGGKSIGLNHAVISNFCSLFPQWRYISFDTYYTYGSPLCEPYFSTWPEDMKVRSAGMFGLPREKILADWSKGDVIVFSVRVAWDEPEWGRMIHAVAKAFPQIPILVQVKRGYISDQEIAKRVATWTEGHPNATYTTESIYDLMERARYHISDISTVIGEALHLGVRIIFADVIDQEYSIFRKFPGLSIRTADDLVRRLQALEDGSETYPYEDYLKIMDLSPDRTIYDIVREDIGLAPHKDSENMGYPTPT